MSDPIHIEINGQTLPAAKGQMIIQVADAHGLTVPRFCYHHKLRVAANCRMCLVEVEKMPKPVPACATPVADGMKVFTKSVKALDAQRAVMEFLLINHPLDCPICDEGGECDLQDTVLGFGLSQSVYTETKRVVGDPDLGPLIATEMTRCIHCTRCVRFGEDIAGIKELGATGRGETMRIGTYVARAVESEISGNVIDLCPVGALTSKPFRFTARSWEVLKKPSISPHDCLGSHLELHVVHGQVKRAVPRVCEAINEEWLSDRDRFAYVGLHAPDRLLRPQLRRADGAWVETSWQEALAAAADGIRHAVEQDGGDALGVLLSPTLSTEELYLAQKLARALGSNHVDHRLRQQDFSAQASAPLHPGLADIAGVESADVVVLIGSHLRKDVPLLNTRVRKAAVRGAQVYAINPVDYAFNYPLAGSVVATPAGMVTALGDALRALAGDSLEPGWAQRLGSGGIGDDARALAQALRDAQHAVVLVGEQALASPYAGALRALGEQLARRCGAAFGELTPGGNGAGAWVAGAIPHRLPGGEAAPASGLDALSMLREPRQAYVLMGIEPDLDVADPAAARAAFAGARCVVAISSYATDALRRDADVLLPLAPFSESAGTFINCAGTRQSFQAALRPAGEARPGWKILRVLGDLLDAPGFAYDDLDAVRAEFAAALEDAHTAPAVDADPTTLAWPGDAGGLVRLGEVPPYAGDAIVRRSLPLQRRTDVLPAAVHLCAAQAQALGLDGAGCVRVAQGAAQAVLPLVLDESVPPGAVRVPAACPETADLGLAWGEARVEAAP